MRERSLLPLKVHSMFLALACLFAVLLALGSDTARAERVLIEEALLSEEETKRAPGGQIEGACGIALRGGQVYVSDYYHHTIDIFPAGRILGNPLDGYCGLAFAPDGALYANEWHEAVYQVLPSKQLIDSDESTGVAVDQASGDVYVNDRTYVAHYEAPIAPEEPPVEKIGLGSLEEGYGVAVEAGRVYVPDAGTNTVKVYEPAVDSDTPAFVINGGFTSLRDSAIATDPTNGHVLVLDNLQPGFEFPEGAVDEFSSSGAFLGELTAEIVDGEPSGLTVSEGDVFVTTGNSEESNVMQFGPYVSSLASSGAPSASAAPQAASSTQPQSERGQATAPASAADHTPRPHPAAKQAHKRGKRHRRAHHGRHALAQRTKR
jgi:DNA-binding beta-propeller fold protein YncE